MSRGLTEQFEPESASPERRGKDPDSLIYGIRWPANRLTHGQMQTLRQISKDVHVPITQLLKDAVDIYLIVLQREMHAMMVAEQATQSEVSTSTATGVGRIDVEPRTIENRDAVSAECLDTNATNAGSTAIGL